MPYRETAERADDDAPILPLLRPGSDPSRGARRRLLPGETSLEAPWVYLSRDGAVALSEEEIARDFSTLSGAFDAASLNLDPDSVSHRRVEGAHVYEGPLAAELVVCASFRTRLHREVGASKLFVAIPERGMLIAVEQGAGQAPLARARRELKLTHAEPITAWSLRVERGKIRGRAPAVAGDLDTKPRHAALERDRASLLEPAGRLLEREEGLGPARGVRPSSPPAWEPKSLGGKIALAAFAIVGLMVLAALRGGVAREREARDERMLTAALNTEGLDALREANETFEREVTEVQVEERSEEGGVELTLSSLREDPSAYLYLTARAEREAARRAGGPPLQAIHLRLTPAQAPTSSRDELDRAAEGLRRSMVEAGAPPALRVTFDLAS